MRIDAGTLIAAEFVQTESREVSLTILVITLLGLKHGSCNGGLSMRVLIGALLVSASTLPAYAGDVSTKEAARIQEAATVLKEIHAVPDKDVPQDLWDRAECVIVVPGLKKAAFVIGGEYGKGLMSCKHNGDWTAPIFMEIGKGSWGLQIGAQSIDLVLLVMNKTGMGK